MRILQEVWVIVNHKGEYLERVVGILQDYTSDLNKAMKFPNELSARKECDVLEYPKQIH